MSYDNDHTEERGSAGSGTALFVRRPVLAFVLSALIVIAGVAGIVGVEVRELPNVDRPVVTVTTQFAGAAPETIDREVTARIESAAGRVSGVESISSSSRFGRSRIVVEFADSVDLDAAANDMRDSIARVAGDLPDDADDPSIVKADADSDAVMRIAITSDQRPAEDLTRLVEDLVEDRLISADGVADLQVYGNREPVFRVDVDMLELASRGLTLADLSAALDDVAFDAPAGALSSDSQSIQVRTTAAISTAEEFEALELTDDVDLGDVASVSLGPAPGESMLRANGQAGIGIGIIRQATSNTLDISRNVRATVAELQEILPDDVDIFVTSDDATFISGSITEVLKTLAFAVMIVVGIIFLFLRDPRATLIPALTMPVALIGTVAAIWMVGFSINILTLLALVLATGLVVDDAIVVLENIVRRRSQGMGPRAAAVLGTRQVFFAVITTTATLAAVFIPLSFLPGQTGGLFREFGFTLAMAVLISSFVALTLCPVLASRLLKDADGPVRRSPGIILGEWFAALYRRTLNAALNAPLVVVTVALLFAAAAALVSGNIRQELTPAEDRSVALLSISAPQDVALDYTSGKMRQIEDLVQPLIDDGEITNLFSIAGFRGRENRGFMVMTLPPWEERERSQDEIVDDINASLRQVIGLRAFAIQPNSLGIRGAGRGLRFALVGASYDELAANAEAMIERMEENPAMGDVELGYDTTQPELFVSIDRTRAADLGIEIDGLGTSLQAVLDGRSVGNVFIDDRSFDVKLVSTTNPVRDPGDLERIFAQTRSGDMVPLSSFVSLEERAVAPELAREVQQRSVDITASLTPELSLGDALAEVRAIGDEILPAETNIVPLSEAATLEQTSEGVLLVFGFAILVVFLVLAAQFESFLSSIIVMATVPLGLACAMVALLLSGVSLNVYSQIGLVLLVGIMAKNGILIVEFANQLRDQGYALRESILEASCIRLRPVMMTMASTVLGGVPLVLSSGAGAEAREALGWVIVGGLGLAAVTTLYVTPVAYLMLARFTKPKAAEEARLREELDAAARPAPAPAE